MNGVNLESFSFEFDLTWMAFFQDASGRTYARYGGRDDAGPESYLNQESLVKTMKAVLKLHEDGAVQEGSRFEPVATTTTTPSQLPLMKAMIDRRKVSCIHCHDVKVTQLRHRHALGTLRKNMVFTYPDPRQLGIVIDPHNQNVIAKVEPESAAANAGLMARDKLIESDGQRILTYADFTRVLELAPEVGTVHVVAERNGQVATRTLQLRSEWRISDDPSWRASLHTVGPSAGFWGQPANEGQRQALGLSPKDLALKVTVVWAAHAKAASVHVGDVVVELDGKRKNMNMRQCHAHLQLNRNWGDQIKLVAFRDSKRVELEMKLPSKPSFE